MHGLLGAAALGVDWRRGEGLPVIVFGTSVTGFHVSGRAWIPPRGGGGGVSLSCMVEVVFGKNLRI